jgi:hypothetical protein
MVGYGRANHAGTCAQHALDAMRDEAAVHRPAPDATEPGRCEQARTYGDRNRKPRLRPRPLTRPSSTDAAVRWAADPLPRIDGWMRQLGDRPPKSRATRRRLDASFAMNAFGDAVRLNASGRTPAPGRPTPPQRPLDKTGDLDMDAKAIHEAVWGRDAIPSPTTAASHTTNPTWRADSYLPALYDQIAKLTDKVDALSKQVAELKKPA